MTEGVEEGPFGMAVGAVAGDEPFGTPAGVAEEPLRWGGGGGWGGCVRRGWGWVAGAGTSCGRSRSGRRGGWRRDMATTGKESDQETLVTIYIIDGKEIRAQQSAPRMGDQAGRKEIPSGVAGKSKMSFGCHFGIESPRAFAAELEISGIEIRR